ncbi:MAG: ABC transporter permease [Muribaculaceae bacterium]|nr:ABC transporter permease [Muribaculaceae bacterium]
MSRINNLRIIIAREWKQRVKRKSFIITTLIMPIVMVGLMVLPVLITALAAPDNQQYALIDQSGRISETLDNTPLITYVRYDGDTDYTTLANDEQFEGVLVIGPDIIQNPDDVRLYTRESASSSAVTQITAQLKNSIEAERLKSYDIENLGAILNQIEADVNVSTVRFDAAQEKETSLMMSALVGIAFSFLLYMLIMLYGNMVMTSIIEEKTNRVLELVVSSVRPFELMVGKIVGIGLVALTQVAIWVALIGAFVAWALPAVIAHFAGAQGAEAMDSLFQLGQPSYIITLMLYMMVFLIGGYLFYAAIYAVVGSSVDNIQDAGQLASVAVVPIILSFILAPTVVAEPNSTVALWASFIPITSPIVMMARLPFAIPVWQTLISMGILYISVIIMIWLAAKIYRVGIFMYGKKPSFKELVRWARYK